MRLANAASTSPVSATAIAALLLLAHAPLEAMQVTGYSATANDRFSSGYPSAPVKNTSASFVGLPYSLSAVGWSSADATKSFGFITPRHYLVAGHYAGAATLRLFGEDLTLSSHTQSSITATGFGTPLDTSNNQISDPVPDLSLGRLSAPVLPASRLARYGILDLNPSSTTNSASAYTGQSLLIYGRGPTSSNSTRVATASLNAVTLANPYFTTTRTGVQLETGDSGSPVFAVWTNPEGQAELALLGNHSAVDDTFNYHSFLGVAAVIQKLNELANPDGFAIRVVGNTAATWVGQTTGNISARQAWGLSAPASAPSDVFVLFNAASTTGRTITVDSARSLRGLHFKSTATASDGFTFNGTAALTLGRGGLNNRDTDRHTFNAPLALGAPQVWLTGPGGITTAAIDTNGNLLEIIGGSGEVLLNGAVSDAGGLAVTDGTVRLAATNTYTGATWVHGGTLRVDGSIAASTDVRIGVLGTLSGRGALPAINGSGTVSPGPAATILSAPSLDLSQGIDLDFTFTAFSPNYGSAAASLNDVLRLTGATPLPSAASASNTVRFFLSTAPIGTGDVLSGGIFCDSGTNAAAALSSSVLQVFVPDASGSVLHEGQTWRAYAGALGFSLGSAPATAAFAGGSVNGSALTLTATTNPSAQPTTYAAWTPTQFNGAELANALVSGPSADADGDGLSNFDEYAFGSNARVPDARFTEPVAFIEAGHLRLNHRRRAAATDLLIVAEVASSPAGPWSAEGISIVATGSVDSTGIQLITLEDGTVLGPANPSRYFRLRAQTTL